MSNQTSNKKAYPNFEQIQNIPGTHDMDKWLQAVKALYYDESKNNASRKDSIRKVTQGWMVTEVNDFTNWLRFYEEGTHLKYKTAQFWYGNADTGYLLPIKQDPKKEEPTQVDGHNIDSARNSADDELSASEKKKIIEKQRNKIIGRLDSAEKLLRSQDGQMFADKEFSSLLETIYELKKKIQMVNKISSSDKLYFDMIIREANRLTNKGFVKAANMLYSLADSKPTDPKAELPPAPPMNGSGAVGGLPVEAPSGNNPPNLIEDTDKSKSKSKGVDQFLNKLENGNVTTDATDANDVDEDILEVMDEEEDLVVEAQAMEPLPEPLPESTKEVLPDPKSINPTPTLLDKKPDSSLEVKENDTPGPAPTKDFDHMMEAIFSNLTIADVVAKFEDIAKFYKTREMPRQLAFADMMLDSLGLAPFFPSLSEATNKALEANNYISTRLEDIISKLRGTMKTRDIDMKDEENKMMSPEISKTQEALKTQEEKNKAKKQMRKDLEDQELESQVKETPEIEVEEDLGNKPPEKSEPLPSPPPPAPAKSLA
jgi:hypothetical protein